MVPSHDERKDELLIGVGKDASDVIPCFDEREDDSEMVLCFDESKMAVKQSRVLTKRKTEFFAGLER